jgi:hypothetical protein
VTPAALRQLIGLVEARKARDLARLDALLVEDRRLAADIVELAATGARDMAEGVEVPLAQQARRLAWADQCIAAARRRRAALAPEIAAARLVAARSLGKHRALEHLEERAARALARLRDARAEREMPPPDRP